MAKLSKFRMKGREHVNPATAKAVHKSRLARLAKVKVESFKCTKWVLACTSKFKKPATNAVVKARL